MSQTHTRTDTTGVSRCLPGSARFLAVSAAYLAAEPARIKATGYHKAFAGAGTPAQDPGHE